MKTATVKTLRGLGNVWLVLAIGTILVGYAAVLYFEGFERFAEVADPRNVIGFAVNLGMIAPGFGLRMAADKLETRWKV